MDDRRGHLELAFVVSARGEHDAAWTVLLRGVELIGLGALVIAAGASISTLGA